MYKIKQLQFLIFKILKNYINLKINLKYLKFWLKVHIMMMKEVI